MAVSKGSLYEEGVPKERQRNDPSRGRESFESSATSPTPLSNDAGSEHIKGNDKNPVIPSELPPRNHFSCQNTVSLSNIKIPPVFRSKLSGREGGKSRTSPLYHLSPGAKAKRGGERDRGRK
ncbi:hypothetical protein AVEN_111490-1 [Araneus ventricosus]|uniref:Uncharacterized protein n=1 Tax=Araneus ventricosus TaxID=182803 RepID=A0A4Y2A3I9_ARAVE|nr:hypothetical protein AVEN_111490-1 [Araneus ventricosus]